MALVTRARIAGILAICLLMLGAPGALAGPTPIFQPDAQIRRGSDVSYTGANIYYPIFQGVGNNGVVGQKLTFVILIENDSCCALFDSFKVKRLGFFNEGFRVRYYDAANNDVTGQVNTGTFTTPVLDSGEQYLMSATVKIRPQATACSSPVQRTITVTSVSNSVAYHFVVKDAVTFTVGLITC